MRALLETGSGSEEAVSPENGMSKEDVDSDELDRMALADLVAVLASAEHFRHDILIFWNFLELLECPPGGVRIKFGLCIRGAKPHSWAQLENVEVWVVPSVVEAAD